MLPLRSNNRQISPGKETTDFALLFLLRTFVARQTLSESRLQPLFKGLDWNRLVELCERNRVTPFVWRALSPGIGSKADFSAENRRLFESAPERYQEHARVRRLAEDRCCRWFEEARIPFFVVKGRTIADLAYSPDERARGDVDVWIKPESLFAAHALLVERGFLPVVNRRPFRWQAGLRAKSFTPEHLAKELSGRVDYHDRKGNHIDLHWNPRYAYGPYAVSFDLQKVWAGDPVETVCAQRTMPLDFHHVLVAAHAMSQFNTKLVHWLDLVLLERLDTSLAGNLQGTPYLRASLPSRKYLSDFAAEVRRQLVLGRAPGQHFSLPWDLHQHLFGEVPTQISVCPADLSTFLKRHRSQIANLRLVYLPLYLLGYFLPDYAYFSPLTRQQARREFYGRLLRSLLRLVRRVFGVEC